MLEKIKKISESAYDLGKALAYANLEQADVDDLRSKIQVLEHVPKSLLDKQVKTLKTLLQGIKIVE